MYNSNLHYPSRIATQTEERRSREGRDIVGPSPSTPARNAGDERRARSGDRGHWFCGGRAGRYRGPGLVRVTIYRMVFDEPAGFAVEVTDAEGCAQMAAFGTEAAARAWITEQLTSAAAARLERARPLPRLINHNQTATDPRAKLPQHCGN
jgi:hypothetical protein